jgi:hypothetical protein
MSCTHPPEVLCHRCAPADLSDAVTETLVDMIKNRTYCGCCDSDTTHARLIVSMLKRFPVETWPTEAHLDAEGVKGFFDGSYIFGGQPRTSMVYDAVALAIRNRQPPP